MENPILQLILGIFALFVLFGITGLWLNTFASGYKSLEHKKKSSIRNLYEGVVDFFKVLLP